MNCFVDPPPRPPYKKRNRIGEAKLMIERLNAYNYEDLLASGRGELFGEGYAQLPAPPHAYV